MTSKYISFFLVLIDGKYYALNESDKDIMSTNSKTGIDVIGNVKIPTDYLKYTIAHSRYNN